MTAGVSLPPARPAFVRALILSCGVVTGLISAAAFVAFAAFVAGVPMPHSLDVGYASPPAEALAIDLLLIALFGVQHSLMARQSVKAWLRRIMPAELERSFYVLGTSVVLGLLFWQWRPITLPLWSFENGLAVAILTGGAIAGWLIALGAMLMMNPLELLGFRQAAWSAAAAPVTKLKIRGLYRRVRHPIYFGLFLALWCTPTMTAGHALFAAGCTLYVIIGVYFEEKDLVREFGDEYRRYQRRVPMLVPHPIKRGTPD